MDVEALLRFAVEKDASDVHIQSGSRPMLRVDGQMRSVAMDPIDETTARRFIEEVLPEDKKAVLDTTLQQGLDFSYAIAGLARFRCSVYRQLGTIGVAIRIIHLRVPSLDELNLPKVIHDIALAQRGLILVTGTTGCGKSTTLAAMMNLINSTYRCKIITIEDPVEFVYEPDHSMISQFEVGADTPSFGCALRQSLRQDPDVILIGELRDADSLRIALHAADTGHQVFSTIHSAEAPQTVERVISMFPPAEHQLLLSQLASSLEAIISQRLVRTIEGGRRPAVEVLRGSAVSEYYVMDNQPGELRKYLETGDSGMQSFDQHLMRMYQDGVINAEEALRNASNAEKLSLKMRMSARRRRGEAEEVALKPTD
jgi:twitching motility protein PilT